MRAALLAVSIADLQRVAATYLRPDVMSLGVVAPHAQAAVLEGLGFSLQKL
jgi:predicted Zn-dependent peptidase